VHAVLAALLALVDPAPPDWMDSPAGLLATAEERAAYQRLDDRARRVDFIADFWARRDPVAATRVNELRQEFEARLEFVNQNFDEPGLEGWQTHRGRVYLVLGPPAADLPRYVPNPDSGGMYPARAWSYRFELLGFQAALLFVDTFHNGHYWLLPPVLRQGDLRAAIDAWRNQAAAERFPAAVARALQRANLRAIQTTELAAPERAPSIPATAGAVESPPLDFKLATSARDGQRLISVTFKVPYRRLVFTQQQGRLVCGLSLHAMVRDRDHRVEDRASARERFELKPEELKARAEETYLRVLTLSAGPAAFALHLRVAWEPPTPPGESSEVVPLP
jgi:GWxTD domain-containing protein